MAAATTEADEAIASSGFVQIMGIPLKKLLAGTFWSFLVTSPRLILRSGYGLVTYIIIMELFTCGLISDI